MRGHVFQIPCWVLQAVGPCLPTCTSLNHCAMAGAVGLHPGRRASIACTFAISMARQIPIAELLEHRYTSEHRLELGRCCQLTLLEAHPEGPCLVWAWSASCRSAALQEPAPMASRMASLQSAHAQPHRMSPNVWLTSSLEQVEEDVLRDVPRTTWCRRPLAPARDHAADMARVGLTGRMQPGDQSEPKAARPEGFTSKAWGAHGPGRTSCLACLAECNCFRRCYQLYAHIQRTPTGVSGHSQMGMVIQDKQARAEPQAY